MKTYVTTKQIAAHAGKRRETVVHALRQTKTPVVKQEGVKGLRVELRHANAFLLIVWPEAGPINPQDIVRFERMRAEERALEEAR
jgi:hypothetical protein